MGMPAPDTTTAVNLNTEKAKPAPLLPEVDDSVDPLPADTQSEVADG